MGSGSKSEWPLAWFSKAGPVRMRGRSRRAAHVDRAAREHLPDSVHAKPGPKDLMLWKRCCGARGRVAVDEQLPARVEEPESIGRRPFRGHGAAFACSTKLSAADATVSASHAR